MTKLADYRKFVCSQLLDCDCIITCLSVCYFITRGGTGTRRLSGSGRVLHYPALPGPNRVLL